HLLPRRLSDIHMLAHGDRTGWLGREDSNLRMAESKSTYFACLVNAYSEKFSKIDRLPLKRLALISERPRFNCDFSSNWQHWSLMIPSLGSTFSIEYPDGRSSSPN